MIENTPPNTLEMNTPENDLAVVPGVTFSSFLKSELILKAVEEQGYTIPTPIQAQAIPHVLAGRDVMGAAQTGTGKTAAFVLPILEMLLPMANTSSSPARHPLRALVLTPTRELSDQVAENADKLLGNHKLLGMSALNRYQINIDDQSQSITLIKK